jgi:hypothetical protein
MKRDLQGLDLVCFACERDDHVVRDCPTLHFILDKYLYYRVMEKYYGEYDR